MRFVMVGVGAIGGTVAARLVMNGHDVVGVARGAHGAAIKENGLTYVAPDGTHEVRFPVVSTIGEVDFREGDVVLISVKGQDTQGVLDELREAAPVETPVVCLQNGIDNERKALRLFPNVYSIVVMLPAEHLEPGVVRNFAAPRSGILDVGRYPSGTDAVSDAIATALEASNFSSKSQPDAIVRKRRKLLQNLNNAINVVAGRVPRDSELFQRVIAEGEAVMAAAGLEVNSDEGDRERRGDHFRMAEIPGGPYQASSTAQSVMRGTPVETDYLTGEIVLLGRLHGVPTPINELLQRLVHEASVSGESGKYTADDLLAMLG